VTTPFNNPLTGAQGSLVRAQIKSPNFSLAGQTGWAIMKNGNAYFFNITAEGTITATEFIGTDFLMTSTGLFYYNGTPGAGDLICAIAPEGTTQDPFGNAVTPVVNIGSATGPHLNIDGFGNLTVFNASGKNVGQWEVGDGSMRFYGTTGPAAGSLVLAISPIAGTDGEANAYAAGLAGPVTAIQPGSSPNALETWHAITLASGWSTVAGQPVPSYRLLADGTVEITGSATHASFAAATALTASGALPAAYRPATTQFVPGCLATDAAIEITTAGLINAEPPAATTSCRFNGTYPINL
jgi:hypothetical protein